MTARGRARSLSSFDLSHSKFVISVMLFSNSLCVCARAHARALLCVCETESTKEVDQKPPISFSGSRQYNREERRNRQEVQG